jgi:hypothetical protein
MDRTIARKARRTRPRAAWLVGATLIAATIMLAPPLTRLETDFTAITAPEPETSAAEAAPTQGPLPAPKAAQLEPELPSSKAPQPPRELPRDVPVSAAGSSEGQSREGGDEPGVPGHLGAESTTSADGVLPEGATVFAVDYPGIGNLNPALLQALHTAAAEADFPFYVTSGWRSASYQQQLLDQAITMYGSKAEASKWVAPAGKSLHVSGDAVDLGGTETQRWLAKHGARYGLCLVYDNEPWHFEFRPDAPRQGCPDTHPDSSHDPRLK